MSLKVSNAGLDAVSRTARLQKAKEERIKFLKKNNTFHYGNVTLPDPDLDSAVWLLHLRTLNTVLIHGSFGMLPSCTCLSTAL